MATTPWTQRIPRSLRVQIMVLLGAALVVSALLSPFAQARARRTLEQELDKRGQNMARSLEKHADLRLAISQSDAAQATPVLKDIVANDDDIEYVAIVGPDHKIIAAAGGEEISPDNLNELVAEHFTKVNKNDQVVRFTQPVSSTTRSNENGLSQETHAAGAQLGKSTEPPAYIVLALSLRQMSAHIWQQTLAFSGAATLILFALFILLYFSWLGARLSRMVQFAQTVAGGNLTQSLAEPFTDDIGALAIALQSMSDHTRTVIGELQTASKSLSAAANELLEASSRQFSNATSQAGSVAEMSATVTELRETFSHATSKAESVIDLARRSEESSAGGTNSVEETISGMEQIREQVTATARTISGLVNRIEQIDAIIDVVNDLAEQSNVLAINAGIEAARAGEHGRGFAVVAREVRSLAERSKESTAQVRAILEDIAAAGNEAVRAIDEGKRRTETGMDVARAAGESIELLGQAIAASSSAAMQIATVTREQSASVTQIWEATKDLDRIAGETTTGTKNLEDEARNAKTLSASLAEIVGRYTI